MAQVAKIDAAQLFIKEESVSDKPPLPSRPSSGQFHNRGSGKLFPTTSQNRLFTNGQANDILSNRKKKKISDSDSASNTSDNSLALEIHPDFKPSDTETLTSTPKELPNYCRRTQSAKARNRQKVEGTALQARPHSAAFNTRKSASARNAVQEQPMSVINLAHKVIPDLFEIEKEKLLALPDTRNFNQNVFQDFPPMHFTRPSSGKLQQLENDPCFSRKDKMSESDLKPSIYGLQRHRHYFGSEPDLSAANCDLRQFPYKITDEVEEEQTALKNKNNRSVPATLDPLLPWLQRNIPEEILGVNPQNCLVFLAPVDWSQLTVVPEPVGEDEDLPFMKDVTTPKPWNPKKYPYYNGKTQVEDWVCRHGAQTPGLGECSESTTLYRQTFKLPRMRTADVVRKEITDLENLLKGIGSSDSSCSMVKYQSEITNFKDILQDTLALVPERLKNPPDPPDPFGFHKMCADHDKIVEKIAQRVQECRAELAELELEAGIETARRHFQRANSIT